MQSSTNTSDTHTTPALKPLIISAPFGNYIQPDGATATLGTFTRHRRPGRLGQIIRTVRYYRRLGAWVNRIGLRNPGIENLAVRVESGSVDVADKIVSIHGFNDQEWTELLAKTAALKPLAIELNMSCPNVGEINFPPNLFTEAAATGTPVIVKLPPVNYQDLLQHALKAGLRTFHCFNTLPVPAGGLSGRPLKPIALQGIRDIYRIAGELDPSAPPQLHIIAGGGIQQTSDIDDYKATGAHRFAIATKCFNPMLLFTHGPLGHLIEHAKRVSSGG